MYACIYRPPAPEDSNGGERGENVGPAAATSTSSAVSAVSAVASLAQEFSPRYERHRNMAISGKQGNRNPFIDFPEWAERVDFEKGLG